jgi:hypothetical protein
MEIEVLYPDRLAIRTHRNQAHVLRINDYGPSTGRNECAEEASPHTLLVESTETFEVRAQYHRAQLCHPIGITLTARPEPPLCFHTGI